MPNLLYLWEKLIRDMSTFNRIISIIFSNFTNNIIHNIYFNVCVTCFKCLYKWNNKNVKIKNSPAFLYTIIESASIATWYIKQTIEYIDQFHDPLFMNIWIVWFFRILSFQWSCGNIHLTWRGRGSTIFFGVKIFISVDGDIIFFLQKQYFLRDSAIRIKFPSNLLTEKKIPPKKHSHPPPPPSS